MTFSDREQQSVRVAVASIDRDLAALATRVTTAGDKAAYAGLAASWGELLKLIAPAPSPRVRACPNCRQTVMRAATRCGFCWSTLSPLPEENTDGME